MWAVEIAIWVFLSWISLWQRIPLCFVWDRIVSFFCFFPLTWPWFGKCTSTTSPAPGISDIAAGSQSQIRLVLHKCRSCFWSLSCFPLSPDWIFLPVLCFLKLPWNISQGNCVYPVLAKAIFVWGDFYPSAYNGFWWAAHIILKTT